MRIAYASLAVATALSPVLGFAMPIPTADTLTGRSVTDAYISGALDSRLTELGTQFQTKEFMPLWFQTQERGLKTHCRRVLTHRGTFNGKCNVPVTYKQAF